MVFYINGREYVFVLARLAAMKPKRFIEFLMNLGIAIKRHVLRDITNDDSKVVRELTRVLANDSNTPSDWTKILGSVIDGTVSYIEVEQARDGGAQVFEGKPAFV